MRSLFCLAFIGNAFVAALHIHSLESDLHISNAEHQSECVLCELGIGSSISLPCYSSKLTFSKFLANVEKHEFLFVRKLSHQFSSRAPPVV